MNTTDRARQLRRLMEKKAFSPAGPPPGAEGGMPPMDPMMAMGGGMPPGMPPGMPAGAPMDPMMMAPPPMPPPGMGGAEEPQSVNLSMADLKAILEEASGGSKGGKKEAKPAEGDPEQDPTTADLSQRVMNIESMLSQLMQMLTMPPPDMGMGGGMPPMDPMMAGGMPPAGGGEDPMAALAAAGAAPDGGAPMDPMMAAGGPPPADPNAGSGILSEEAMKTASDKYYDTEFLMGARIPRNLRKK